MSNYISQRSKSACIIWQILCEHAKTGLRLSGIRLEYEKRTGESFAWGNRQKLFPIMQSNRYFIWDDGVRLYPYHDDVSGLTFEHECVNGVVKLVELEVIND